MLQTDNIQVLLYILINIDWGGGKRLQAERAAQGRGLWMSLT